MADETQRSLKVEESPCEAYFGQHEDEDLFVIEEGQIVKHSNFFVKLLLMIYHLLNGDRGYKKYRHGVLQS